VADAGSGRGDRLTELGLPIVDPTRLRNGGARERSDENPSRGAGLCSIPPSFIFNGCLIHKLSRQIGDTKNPEKSHRSQ
jgi:hypothetical protein